MQPNIFSFLPSPFFNHRPPGTVIDLLVIHAISLPPGHFGGPGINDLFLGRLNQQDNKEYPEPFYQEIALLQVSAHFLIDRWGGVTQYVPVLLRAWHVGQSLWKGRPQCNDFSIGVELEGDANTPFESIQYQVLASLVRSLQEGLIERGQPGFTHQDITGHQHIAPERKWDPGPFFDWKHFHAQLDINDPVPDGLLVWQ